MATYKYPVARVSTSINVLNQPSQVTMMTLSFGRVLEPLKTAN